MRLASSIDPGRPAKQHRSSGFSLIYRPFIMSQEYYLHDYHMRNQIPRTTEAREQVGNATSDVAILLQNTGRVSYLTGRGLWFQAQSFSVAIETD